MDGECQSDLLDDCVLIATPYKQAVALFLQISSLPIVWLWCNGKHQTCHVDFFKFDLHFLLVTTKEYLCE